MEEHELRAHALVNASDYTRLYIRLLEERIERMRTDRSWRDENEAAERERERHGEWT